VVGLIFNLDSFEQVLFYFCCIDRFARGCCLLTRLNK
jgi:hypothetical protein